MASKVDDAYTVLLRQKKLPLSLLQEPKGDGGAAGARAGVLATQPFAATFGKKQSRKRPKLAVESLGDMVAVAGERAAKCDCGGGMRRL